MEGSIGERIKSLRKEFKLTQSQLAGSEMTKSMLSQIENNQATPSMKSLQYLAAKLGKPISFFIDNNETVDNTIIETLPIEDINKKLKSIDLLIKNQDYSIAHSKIEELICSYKYDENSKLFADILYKHGECLIDMLDFDNGEEKIKISVKIYTELQLFTYAARANMELIGRYYNAYQYDDCLKILDACWSMYKHAINRDIILEIEMLFYRALIKLANSTAEDVINLIQKALDISKENGAYYKSDELYRLKAFVYFIIEKYDDFDFCIKKAIQFAQFTDDIESLAKIKVNLAMYENVLNNPQKALEHLEHYAEYGGKKKFNYYINLAYSYYLLEQYEQAYDAIQKVDYTPCLHHKVDYLMMWMGKVYEGLILNKMGKSKEAITSINIAIEKLDFFTESKYLAFAYESLSNIYSEAQNFEAAYEAIKKAYTIRSNIIKKGKIAY